MHIQKSLEQIGYGTNEAKTYLASLSLGETTITEIASKAKIPRTTCQNSISILQQEGLINSFVRRRRKYWIAENPQKILSRLKEKETTLKALMPELQALRYETGVQPTVRFFRGVEGISHIVDDIIETKQHIRSLTSREDALLLLSDEYRYFIEQRYTRHLRVHFLTKRSPETLEHKKDDARELRHTRFLPADFEIKNANYIYGDKIAIISLNKNLPMGIIIADADIAKTQSELFDYIWKQSSE